MPPNYSELLQVDKLKLKTIRILFPLHRESLTSYLSPLLGQYAIKNSEFINEFVVAFHAATNNTFKDILNVESAESGGSLYNEEIFVPLLVKIYKGGKFKIKVSSPSIGFLYSNCFKKRRRIYKRLLSGQLALMRNYKKLFQIATFKQLTCENNILSDNSNTFANLLIRYKESRNALNQRK